MQLTKGAIGNLINRYKAVLKKCHLLNVFGSLAVASMLVMGIPQHIAAADISFTDDTAANPPLVAGPIWNVENSLVPSDSNDNTVTVKNATISGDVYGNGLFSKEVSRNKITVTNSQISGDIYGGVNQNGNVSDNIVTIDGETKVNNDVFGGFVYGSGNASGNTVNLNGGSVISAYGGHSVNDSKYNSVILDGADVSGGIYGGSTSGGNVEDNTVSIISGSSKLSVIGGRIQGDGGIANNNKVIMYGGHILENVIGGYLEKGLTTGEISNNSVEIYGGNVDKSVYGGQAQTGSGTISNNKVIMTDGTVNWLMGGYHMGTGTVSGNSVNVSGGTIKGSITGADSSGGDSINNTVVMSNVTVAVVRGGLAGDGIASGNSVTIESGHVTSHAFGGDGQKGSTDNEITLNADAVVDGHLFGGLARGVNAAATGNKVTITGGTVSGNTYGGKNEGSGWCDVSQNTVSISGGYAGQYVVGGYTPTGNATGNTIYMSNGKAGVINAGENDSGTISENTIVFNGGEVNYIQGGYSYSGSIINNKIFINGGTIHNNVLGGVVYTGDGVADNNEIIITGGIFEGDIYGGSAVNSASGNKVTLAGAPTISGHIYGGAGNVTTDNILTFGTSDLAYNGTFEGTFSNFDTLNIEDVRHVF